MTRIINNQMKFIIFFSLMAKIKADNPYCYADDKSPYVYFSQMTSYEASRSRTVTMPKDCSPIHMWALIRHGTRYQSIEKIAKIKNLNRLQHEIVENHEKGRGKLCKEDLERIKQWKFIKENEEQAAQLTTQGKKDPLQLAKRLKQRFAALLSMKTRNDFIIQSTSTERVKESALIFTNELLGTNHTDIKDHKIRENTEFLRPRDFCPKYLNDTNLNEVKKEFIKCLESSAIKNLFQEVTKRLGFNRTLQYDDIESMYTSCAYENAWFVNSKPAFCAVFTEKHLKFLEYIQDLILYYKEGYGNFLNEKLGCPIVRNMMMTLSNITQMTEPKHTATLFFSHSETILPVTVKLGLSRDEVSMTCANYDSLKDHRKWKLSTISGFSSNIIVVLYKCPGNINDENQVVFYQNEREVILPECRISPCSMKFLEKHFQDIYDSKKCNLDFCNMTLNITASKAISISIKRLTLFIILPLLHICFSYLLK